MKLLDKRGEFITVGVIAFALLAGTVGLLVGSSGLSRIIPGLHQKENKTKSTYVSKSESKPIFVTDAKTGQQMVLYSTKTETSTADSSEEQKMTFWQKLWVLPKLWLLFMVLGIFFPPIAAIMGVINHRLMGEAKKIVGGMEGAIKSIDDKPEVKQKILDELSKKYDSSTKALVSNLKRKL